MTLAHALLASGDRGDFQHVNELARDTSWLHGPFVAFADDGVLLFGILLIVGFVLARAERSPLLVARALLAGAGVLIAVAVNQPIVHAVNEQRPYTQLPDVLVLVHRSLDASFPSDHATMAGAAAVGLLLVHRRLGLIATAAAVLMAFTRVYVGAHFPIDVLAGLALGAVIALLVQLAAPALSTVVRRLERTPARPLLTT
ncbi:MAG: Undecaprenyl-diphosphatase [Frankiales bacterium]|nr:Undecaprenyl-diphosphatase [Frankiales bacterium]